MTKFTTEPFWIERGEKTLMKDMSEEALNKAYTSTQLRQMEAYSKLEFLIRLEDSLKEEAKSKNIKLKEINETCDNEHKVRKFLNLKELLKGTVKSIKLRNSKREKTEVLLQEA